MKISEFQDWLSKAFAKYGDIEIGCYEAAYANEVAKPEDLSSFSPRVVSIPKELPGDSLEEGSEQIAETFVTLFYDA